MNKLIQTVISENRCGRHADAAKCKHGGIHEKITACGVLHTASQKVAYCQSLCHAIPRMMCHHHVKRKGESEQTGNGLQVAVDVVEGSAILAPLFTRVGRGDYGEEERGARKGVLVCYIPEELFPNYCLTAACNLGRVDKDAAAYVVAGKVEHVVGGHALCVNGEKEHVAGEVDRLAPAVKVELLKPPHLVERKAVLLFLYMVAHVDAFKGVVVLCRTVVDRHAVDTLEVAYVERDAVTAKRLVLKPPVVVPNQPGVEILEGYLVPAEVRGEPADVRVKLMGGVVPAFVLHLPYARPGVCYETNTLSATVRYGYRSCICLFVYQLSSILRFLHRGMDCTLSPSRTSGIHLCSHTVRRYLRQAARCMLELISLQMPTHVSSSVSTALPVDAADPSFAVTASTLMLPVPVSRPRTALTSELSPARTLYKVGAKFLNDSISFSLTPLPPSAVDLTVPPTSLSFALPAVWKYSSRKVSQLANTMLPPPLTGIMPTWA